jgi:hypothetical protein
MPETLTGHFGMFLPIENRKFRHLFSTYQDILRRESELDFETGLHGLALGPCSLEPATRD